ARSRVNGVVECPSFRLRPFAYLFVLDPHDAKVLLGEGDRNCPIIYQLLAVCGKGAPVHAAHACLAIALYAPLRNQLVPVPSRFGTVHQPTGQLIYFLLAVSRHFNSLTMRVDDHQIRLVVCKPLGHQREKPSVGGRRLDPSDEPRFLRTTYRVYLPSAAEIWSSKLRGQTSSCQASCRQANAR